MLVDLGDTYGCLAAKGKLHINGFCLTDCSRGKLGGLKLCPCSYLALWLEMHLEFGLE